MREQKEATVNESSPSKHRLATDNLVIGGGLAGCMAALRLASAGRDVLLVEKERYAHHKVCGEFLSPEAVGYLHSAGVDPVRLGAASIEHLRLSSGRRTVSTKLPFRALSLSRSILDAALIDSAAQAGCTVMRGACVGQLASIKSGWTAELLDKTSIASANVFFGTGKHDLRQWNRGSGVHGDLVGFKMHWTLKREQTEALRNCMELFLFTGGYGGLSLVEADTANLCLVVRRARLRRLGGWTQLLTDLTAENRQIRMRLEGASALWAKPLAVSSIPYGYLAKSAANRWMLGDQAAVIPSFTGDGMSIALHSGALAADMFLSGESADTYQRELRSQLQKGMRLATLLSRIMVTSLGRELAPLALTLGPGLMSWIASATRIPESALVGHTVISME